MEGAQTLVIGPGGDQGHPFTDHLDDVGAILDGLDDFPGQAHGADSSLNRRAGRRGELPCSISLKFCESFAELVGTYSARSEPHRPITSPAGGRFAWPETCPRPVKIILAAFVKRNKQIRYSQIYAEYLS